MSVDASVDAPSAEGYEPQMGVDEWPGFETETIGGVMLGVPAPDAATRLGAVTQKSPPVLEGATGAFAATWSIRGGIELGVASDVEIGTYTVRSIEVSPPSTARTSKGIGIGSTLREVRAAYGPYLSPPTKDSDPRHWLVGSVYGGMLLVVEQDRVARMFLGAMAF